MIQNGVGSGAAGRSPGADQAASEQAGGDTAEEGEAL